MQIKADNDKLAALEAEAEQLRPKVMI